MMLKTAKKKTNHESTKFGKHENQEPLSHTRSRQSLETQRNPEWYGGSATPLKSNRTDPVQRTAKASFSYSLYGPARLPVLEHWEPRSAGLLRWCVPRPLAQRLCDSSDPEGAGVN